MLPVGPTRSVAPFRTRRVGWSREVELDFLPFVEPTLMRPAERVMPLLRIRTPVVSSPLTVVPCPMARLTSTPERTFVTDTS